VGVVTGVVNVVSPPASGTISVTRRGEAGGAGRVSDMVSAGLVTTK
jgi:hypothetical protein